MRRLGARRRVEPPKEMPDDVADRLYALGPEVLELPPDLAAAMRGTQGLIVDQLCRRAAAVAHRRRRRPRWRRSMRWARPSHTAPFGGPPKEPGLNLPRTGFFGWLAEEQKAFYAALTGSLGALRTDWTAFWLLGGLSFLYGILHAAGPGHGKVVISSYMLANETQVRRGITLSVISALLQSLVAVVFVLIAASVLGMTSMAMGDAANWIGIVSYAHGGAAGGVADRAQAVWLGAQASSPCRGHGGQGAGASAWARASRARSSS